MRTFLSSLRSNRSGFTFVELLVVIVLIAVLTAAVANFLFSQGGSKARDTERKNDLRQSAALVEQFIASYGEPPNPSVHNRKIRGRIPACEAVNDYKSLMNCFKAIRYTTGEGLIALAEDPKEGIKNDSSREYGYRYGANSNAWKLCALLENQTDPDLNDSADGSGSYGEEGARSYCMVASNRKLSDISSVQLGSGTSYLND